MWVILGFGALGLLIGHLVGFSATSVVTQLIGVLFVFAGGSLLAFLHKLNRSDRATAGGALMALSLSTVAGIYISILMTEHRWLSPRDTQASPPAIARAVPRPYVRSGAASAAAAIDIRYKANVISLDAAYREMYELSTSYEGALEGRDK